MDNKPLLMLVEDDHHLRELLTCTLNQDFSIYSAGSVSEAKVFLHTHVMDIVIVDINLPDASGLTLCQHIANTNKAVTGVICLSADNSPETVLNAYQIGVDDFIPKPFEPITFHQRVLHFYKMMAKTRTNVSALGHSKSLAQTAMGQAASYGAAMQLMANINQCHDEQGLATTIMSYFMNNDVHACIQFRQAQDVASFDCDRGYCADVELRVFDLLKNQGRIYHFGQRCIFNDSNVSILIKNMPAKDTQLFDELLDVVAKLIPAINARYLAIKDQMALQQAGTILTNLMSDITKNINVLEQDKQQLLKTLESEISMSFHALNMDETQEQFFLKLIEKELLSREENPIFTHIQAMLNKCVSCLQNQDTAKPVALQIESDGVELF